jgi:hypothetical protein
MYLSFASEGAKYLKVLKYNSSQLLTVLVYPVCYWDNGLDRIRMFFYTFSELRILES